MPDQPSDLRPIQVFLDTKRFLETPEPKPFVPSTKDFFEGDNRAFVQHRTKMKTRVEAIATRLRRDQHAGGFVKVRQRQEALAKSHRPVGALFTASNHFALVGADKVGELLFQATPQALDDLAGIIERKAEETPRLAVNKKTGREQPRVSGYRSELGGIEDVRLYEATDKVAFSADEAVRWMRQPNVIGGYIVELFRPERSVSPKEVDEMVAEFRAGLNALHGGLLIRPILPSSASAQFGQPTLALSVHLTGEGQRLIEFPFADDGQSPVMVETALPPSMRRAQGDLRVERHAELLAFLREQSLVRSVELPPILETTPASGGSSLGNFKLTPPTSGADYPAVGIIDGGISEAALSAWKVGDAGLVPPGDRDESHGTFIAGLVSGGSAMNPSLSAKIEPIGCKFYDLDLFPRRELRNRYYADIEELFDVLDEKVKVAKRDHGVRVFNLSFSIGSRSSRLAYSLAADRLDRIAHANDVLFIVAAGNLPAASRPTWPDKAEDAAIMLASFAGDNQHLTAPAEHVLGITVGAVNPHGVSGHAPELPTTYTRRGPGVGGARKPDLSHYGGVEASTQTGLVSLAVSGEAIHNCGTSFAAPLTAATVATLDHRLARQAARETLLALPIHRAKRHAALDRPALRHIAREFVGFGMAPVADMILNDDPHSVTLVFSERIRNKQRLEFPFAWPASLVNADGTCCGRADVTLSFTPPIDPDHREEAIRVQLEAHLYQERIFEETGELEWEPRLNHDSKDVPKGMGKSESYLIRTGLKWSPIKRYHASMPKGCGNTSNWKLSLESLVRAGVVFPKDGVAFCLVMTISDIAGEARVREEVRQGLQNRGLVLADITLAHRVRPRAS